MESMVVGSTPTRGSTRGSTRGTLLAPPPTIYAGNVNVTLKVWGYRKHRKANGRLFDTVDLHLPPHQMDTQGVWVDLPPALAQHVEARGGSFLGGIHAAAHAVMNVVPLHVVSDRADLATECPSPFQERIRPLRLVLYDAAEGGSGLCQEVFRCMGEVLRMAHRLVRDCPCAHGCPSCIHDAQCSEYNIVMDKDAGMLILAVAAEGWVQEEKEEANEEEDAAAEGSGGGKGAVG